MYLETFRLPSPEQEEYLLGKKGAQNGGAFPYIDNAYPCGIFTEMHLTEINFSEITILYGGNGSGKSTLLNLIAEKTKLNRLAPFNTGEMVDSFVRSCTYKEGYDEDGNRQRIPNGSRIITSDDVFDYMLAVRDNNQDIDEAKENVKNDYAELKYGETIHLKGMEDYERLRLQVLSRSRSVSRRKYLRAMAGEEVKLHSNGETALMYFQNNLEEDRLYCLDEPENSLSPAMQLQLAEILKEMSHYGGCQFVIATHSPFLLAMEGARIYNLDHSPVDLCKWWELENTRLFYEFFKKNAYLFEHGALFY